MREIWRRVAGSGVAGSGGPNGSGFGTTASSVPSATVKIGILSLAASCATGIGLRPTVRAPSESRMIADAFGLDCLLCCCSSASATASASPVAVPPLATWLSTTCLMAP